MIRRQLFTLTLVAIFIFPVSASAQTTVDNQYRNYLLQVIELLQQQIAMLQAERVALTNNTITPVRIEIDAFDSFLIEDVDDIEAHYKISDASQVELLSNRTHRKYFSRFFDIVPDEYDDYFIDLLIFEENGNEFDGFVETVPPYRDDTWRIGINESMFDFSLTSDIVEELYVHEFAHIISYEGIVGRAEPRNQGCHEYYDEFGCPPANSYLIDFMNEFWTEEDLNALVEAKPGESIWLNSELEENFVTDYAGTNPAEDFAESFTFFVIEDKAEGNSIIDQKINYFYDFEKMVELRSEIRAAL